MKKNRLLLRTAVCAAVLILNIAGASASVAADMDMDYTGPVDSVTGQGNYAQDGSEAEGDQIQLLDNVVYDRTQAAYVYTVGNSEIVSSVMDGMIVQDTVSIVPDSNLTVTLYCDGEELTDADLGSISEPGSYVLQTEVSGQSQQVMSFTLAGEASSTIDRYAVPTGFVVTAASRDGEEIGWEQGSVDMSTEGTYVIDYSCERAGISYVLNLKIDHTAPVLIIEGVDEDNLARGPVYLLNVEEGATVSIQHNNSWGGYQQKLTQSGEYRVRIQDAAGNSSDYYFTILIYFDSSSFVFIGLVLAVIAAVVGYVVLSRKRLRVR